MVSLADRDEEQLTEKEQERLDALLSSARGFHYTAFVVSGLSLVVSTMSAGGGISLPLGEIMVPRTEAAVGLYLLVIVLAMAVDRQFRTAQPWVKLDPRRLPFAWVAIGTRPASGLAVFWWLMLPVFICTFATVITLKYGDTEGLGLAVVAMLLVPLPRTIYRYLDLIHARADHRGGPATFSIYILYWYRVLRQVLVCFFFLIPLLAVVPTWREPMLRVNTVVLALIVLGFVVRSIGMAAGVYRRIDRFGTRFGFPMKSNHYS